jgi:hypothetical protein
VERIDRRVARDLKGSTDDILTPDKSNAADLAGLSFGLTPAKVTDAFRKHIDPKKLVILRGGNFTK